MSAFGIAVPRECVRIFGSGVSKHDALSELAHAVASTGAVEDVEALIQAVFDREAVMSTGIGSGVAIPHVRIEAVKQPVIGVGMSLDGIDFDTLDKAPVHVIVLFAMPAGSQKEYLKLLAQAMLMMKSEGFTAKLLACTTEEEVVSLLNSDGSSQT